MSRVDLVPAETAQLDPVTKRESPLAGIAGIFGKERPCLGCWTGAQSEDGRGLGCRVPAYFMAAGSGEKERWRREGKDYGKRPYKVVEGNLLPQFFSLTLALCDDVTSPGPQI